jgi:hypothetical protein
MNALIQRAYAGILDAALVGARRSGPDVGDVLHGLRADRSRLHQLSPNDYDIFFRAPCEANPAVSGAPRANVTFTLFGPGGETTANASIFVEANSQP